MNYFQYNIDQIIKLQNHFIVIKFVFKYKCFNIFYILFLFI